MVGVKKILLRRKRLESKRRRKYMLNLLSELQHSAKIMSNVKVI